MRTPSLRRRVLWAGLGVSLAVIILLEAFIVVSFRNSLEETLAEVLDARVTVARELAMHTDTDELTAELVALGIPAEVTDADGRIVEARPAVPRFGTGPPGDPRGLQGPLISEVVALEDGGQIEVFATRAGVDSAVRRMVTLMAIGTLGAIVALVLLLPRATAAAIAPLGAVVRAARRTAEGETGQRLEPDDPTTELGRMASAYDAMLDELEQALERTRNAEERTRRFLDDAAHQLRTPIAGIRAAVEVLMSSEDAAHQDRVTTVLVRETSRASRVLRDLLTMARLDSGRPLTLATTDLLVLCEDEVERTRSLAPALRVTCAATDSIPPVTIDGEAVREAMANLLDNARRHARSSVELRLHADAEVVRIAIGDDGPGLTPGSETLVFQRFATLDGQGGSGLGLPIARSIARSHGGDLVYENGVFVLTLPTRPDVTQSTPSAP